MIHRMLLLAALLAPGLVAAQTPYECGPGNATHLQHRETQAPGRQDKWLAERSLLRIPISIAPWPGRDSISFGLRCNTARCLIQR